MAGYLFPSNWEITGRYTNLELNANITGKNPKKQYSLGLSKYIVGHKLKVQTDISYLDIQGRLRSPFFYVQDGRRRFLNVYTQTLFLVSYRL